MAGIFDNIVKTVKDKAKEAKDRYDEGTKETEGLGAELAARSAMNRAGEAALKGDPAPTPRDESGTGVGGTASPYGTHKGEKRIDTDKYHSPNIKTYDEGGKIVGGSNHTKTYDTGGKVNVNDGKHEVAILKHGERVLTEKQDKEYQKMKAEHGEPDKDEDKGMDCYDEGGKVHTPEEKAHFHRAMSHLNTGGLHRHLGIDEDKPIPMAKKQEAANSSNPHVAAMGRMAVAMHGWNHKKK